MKLASFRTNDGETRIGLKIGDTLADLTAAFQRSLVQENGIPRQSAVEAAAGRMPASMLALIQREEEGQADLKDVAAYLDKAAKGDDLLYAPGGSRITYALEEVRLLKPLQPRRCFNMGHNYPAYEKMGSLVSPYEGTVASFMVTPESTIGPEDVIEWPLSAKEVCLELELGVIIGKTGKRISEANALDQVFGYTVVNDVTGWDIFAKGLGEGREGLPGFYYVIMSKSIDSFQPLRPYIVLKDEIPDPQNVGGELRVNGEPRIWGSTREMRVSVAQILEYHTQDITFYAGDVIASGGMGSQGVEPHAFVTPGDVAEAELDKIGVLRNYVR
ncbi:MAG: fumarylacetoacetate hydrolase family protein [Dehalococcoidia bacterium]|nr:fumarylacetoacetate hydrolase family protein [Dehalococcoidia bacterium]